MADWWCGNGLGCVPWIRVVRVVPCFSVTDSRQERGEGSKVGEGRRTGGGVDGQGGGLRDTECECGQ